ncbi:hydrogenase formation protein HypD [Azotosporobacter soli]|uniref:hydrogenase formation protein HypD n=1 Tax=Azotosporobacter soli TaxID=3055040 RepID=UPI0031FE7117
MQMLTAEETGRAAARLTAEIKKLAGGRTIRIMEVCGTHTVAIFRHGIRQLLGDAVELISGPGCPVCVTPANYIDAALACAKQPGVILTSYGDLLRVPGSRESLAEAKAQGADVRVVVSPLDALAIARQEPQRKVVFLAVGFETTAPTAAAALLSARQAGVENFLLLSAHKTVPPALRSLLTQGACLDGLLLPGHVSAVIGLAPYRFLVDEFALPSVVAGFEALDILTAIRALARQIAAGRAELENQYRRVVLPQGNPQAMKILLDVYQPVDVEWRGLGLLKESGLVLRPAYQVYDASLVLQLKTQPAVEPKGCCCGLVLQGRMQPAQCPLFARECTPLKPVGACMVSREGACSAWYNYGKRGEGA